MPDQHTDSDQADPIRACTRKKGYPSEEVARLSAASIRRTSPGADVRAYGCRHCGMWHVGATPAGERSVRTFSDEPARAARDPYDSARRRGPRRPDRRRSARESYSRGPSRRGRGREETET